MKNTLIDLNNHLFAQLERLGNESMTAEELKHEVERSKAITSVSNQVVSNASLVLEAKRFETGCNGLPVGQKMPSIMLESKVIEAEHD